MGKKKLVFKRIMIYAQVGGKSPNPAAVLPAFVDSDSGVQGLMEGFLVFFVVFCLLLKFLPLPPPLSSNVLAKHYIASSCCVILNQ